MEDATRLDVVAALEGVFVVALGKGLAAVGLAEGGLCGIGSDIDMNGQSLL